MTTTVSAGSTLHLSGGSYFVNSVLGSATTTITEGARLIMDTGAYFQNINVAISSGGLFVAGNGGLYLVAVH